MWARTPRTYDGTYDVDDSVTALIRTEGPVITVNGAWAQNIGQSETYIDFMGDKAGIRLQYGSDFTVYTAEHGALIEYKPEFKMRDHFQNEIDAFVDCVKTGKKLALPHRHGHHHRQDDAGHLRFLRRPSGAEAGLRVQFPRPTGTQNPRRDFGAGLSFSLTAASPVDPPAGRTAAPARRCARRGSG